MHAFFSNVKYALESTGNPYLFSINLNSGRLSDMSKTALGFGCHPHGFLPLPKPGVFVFLKPRFQGSVSWPQHVSWKFREFKIETRNPAILLATLFFRSFQTPGSTPKGLRLCSGAPLLSAALRRWQGAPGARLRGGPGRGGRAAAAGPAGPHHSSGQQQERSVPSE